MNKDTLEVNDTKQPRAKTRAVRMRKVRRRRNFNRVSTGRDGGMPLYFVIGDRILKGEAFKFPVYGKNAYCADISKYVASNGQVHKRRGRPPKVER